MPHAELFAKQDDRFSIVSRGDAWSNKHSWK